MQDFHTWLEGRNPLKPAMQAIVMDFYKKLPWATGAELTKAIHSAGYDMINYKQVMDVLTPFFRERKRQERLDRLRGVEKEEPQQPVNWQQKLQDLRDTQKKQLAKRPKYISEPEMEVPVQKTARPVWMDSPYRPGLATPLVKNRTDIGMEKDRLPTGYNQAGEPIGGRRVVRKPLDDEDLY